MMASSQVKFRDNDKFQIKLSLSVFTVKFRETSEMYIFANKKIIFYMYNFDASIKV